jgi:acetyltransferase-like isoleucine patch superfamily enzyme
MHQEPPELMPQPNDHADPAVAIAPASWNQGALPANVKAGIGTLINGEVAFKRFQAAASPGLVLGRHCTMDGVQFAVGEHGVIEIGDYCYFTNTVLLCELSLRIGSYVVIGWNTTIADTDFHPLAPALRIADAIACSPIGHGRPRPPIEERAVVIEDDVWIGPNATILKGVRIGAGSFIEPGALVTRDVPPRSRVGGNPATVIGPV